MKRFFLKEYGSWTVFLLSFFGGWAFLQRPVPEEAILGSLSLAILMNSKVALQGWVRTKETDSGWAFLLQITVAFFLMLPVVMVMPYVGFIYFLIPALVLLLVIFRKDHRLYGELIGFAYLCLPGAMVLVMAGEPSHWRVFLFLWAFYSVSVFKVRFFMRKAPLWRGLTIISPFLTSALMVSLGFSSLYGLLHLENTLYGLGLRKKSLAYVGWTELLKSVVFTAVLWFSVR